MADSLTDRVVEVIATMSSDPDPQYRHGSGCIVRGGTVITAAHVVRNAQAVRIRTTDKVTVEARLDPAFIGNEPGPDLALIEISDPSFQFEAVPLAAVDRQAGGQVENCCALGYPQFAESRGQRETRGVLGDIPVGSGLVKGLLTMRVRDSPRPTSTGSPWEGISGAAVTTAGGRLIGVLSQHDPAEGSSALTVVPLTALENDSRHPGWGPGVVNASQWWERLGVAGQDELRRFPPRTNRPKPDYLDKIASIRRDTPHFRGRLREIARLAAFATGADHYWHIKGLAKTGKTAFLAEAISAKMPPSVDVVVYFVRRSRNRLAEWLSDTTDGDLFVAALVPQLEYLLDEESPDMVFGQLDDLWRKCVARADLTGRHLLLVVDGLDGDRFFRSRRSVASLLPAETGKRTHVVVTSRVHYRIPRDVDRGHPLHKARVKWLRPYRDGKRKLIHYSRLMLALAVTAVSVVVLSTSSLPPGGTDPVAGNVTLVRQFNGNPALVFSLASGGMAYFTRSNSDWSQPWGASFIDTHQPMVDLSTIFASTYSGFEVLGDDNGKLTFAWRSNYLNNYHWNGPGLVRANKIATIEPNAGKVIMASGRPGFLEYPEVVPTELPSGQTFLALVPQQAGVALYERHSAHAYDWSLRLGVIGNKLGRVTAVTAVATGDGEIVAIIRAASGLYEVVHPAAGLPQNFGSGWTRPAKIRALDGAGISATGDPDLINLQQPPQTELNLVVPIHGGVAVLSDRGGAVVGKRWSVQRLPIGGRADSVTMLGGMVGGQQDLYVVYRAGSELLGTWKKGHGQWTTPTVVMWGTPR